MLLELSVCLFAKILVPVFSLLIINREVPVLINTWQTEIPNKDTPVTTMVGTKMSMAVTRITLHIAAQY